jgi:hypothetical protein
VYAALDWLIEQQTRIEAALAQRHLADGTLVLYDVSSSYMEGRCCALERASIVAPAQPSPAAIEKRTKRHAVDGTPIMAWHDLIAQLGTLTINEVALPLGERRTIQMPARPTALQEQAFALLGVPFPRVQ